MKPGSVLVNTARGAIVDEAADQLVDYLHHDLDPAELAFPSAARVVVDPVGGLRT